MFIFFIFNCLISLLYNCFSYYLVVQFNCSILYNLCSYICGIAILALLSIKIAYIYMFFINIFTIFRSLVTNICKGHFLCHAIFNLLTYVCSIKSKKFDNQLMSVNNTNQSILTDIDPDINCNFFKNQHSI